MGFQSTDPFVLNIITFQRNDGTNTEHMRRAVESGTSITSHGTSFPADPTRPGYIFIGWTMNPNGTGGAFTANTVVNSHTTVYAQWYTTHEVTFNKNNDTPGSTEASPRTIEVGTNEAVTTPTTPPTRPGYVLTGWNTSPDGTGTALTAQTRIDEPTTFYAQWAEPFTVTVTSNDETRGTATAAANGTTSTTVQAAPGQTITLTATAEPGSIFIGWEVTSNNVNLSDNEAATATFTMPAQNVTIKANFAPPPSLRAPTNITFGEGTLPTKTTLYTLAGANNEATATVATGATNVNDMETFELSNPRPTWRIDLTATAFQANGNIGARPVAINNETNQRINPDATGSITVTSIMTSAIFAEILQQNPTRTTTWWTWNELTHTLNAESTPSDISTNTQYKSTFTWTLMNVPA